MKILYVCINFALLAGLIVLFARKTIVKLFSSRRKAINEALDEAQRLEEMTPPELVEPEFPQDPEAPPWPRSRPWRRGKWPRCGRPRPGSAGSCTG